MAALATLALTLPGGGARGAYQAGVLSRLGESFADLDVGIITGVSAGAINATYLANHPGSLGPATRDLAALWAGLDTDHVFRGEPLALMGNAARWSVQLLSGGNRALPGVRGLVDTAPLRSSLERVLNGPRGELSGVRDKLEAGRLTALAVTTTSYSTGQSITFAELSSRRPAIAWQRPYRVGCSALIRVDHVMASAAIPLLFPAVRVDGTWHGDGGVRQSAPLSPALRLGANRIILISTVRGPTGPAEAAERDEQYPSLARILGVTLNALLNDHAEYDAAQLRRITELVRACPDVRSGLSAADVLLIRPSEDLGEIAAEYEKRLPPAVRYLTRGLGTREFRSTDLLSTLLFDSAYTARLIECGRRDAERRIDEVRAFIAAAASSA